MTLPTTVKINSLENTAKESTQDAQEIKKKARLRQLRAAQVLAARIRVAADGSRCFVRFSRAQCLEHQLLMVTFTTLTITGLLQRYSQYLLVGIIINTLGGVDTIRVIHHLAAFLFIIQTAYHLLQILLLWFVKREIGGMWLSWHDLSDLIRMLKFNLGLAKQRPEFDRFSVEEKLEYWALIWGGPLMIITGVMMWFPTIITQVLPGYAIPVSRAIHSWEAVLAALAIVTWHIYHVVLKERNTSIFSGTMTEKQMQHEHPLEYRRIITAYEYLQKVATEKALPKDNPTYMVSTDKETKHELVQQDASW